MATKKIPLWVIVFWLGVWQIGSLVVGYSILLPSPWLTLEKLWALLGQSFFWLSISNTLLSITLGFLSATVTGVMVAVLSYHHKGVRDLVSPIMLISKSVPVASFIILILIWFSSSHLSVIISFIMVLPIIYTNVLTALGQLDSGLIELSQVFEFTPYAKLRYVTLPQVLPYLRSGCLVSLGLSFKAGIAAELIGMPKNSIGEHLFSAKLYLDTPNLFAWTVAIVILSFCYEKLFSFVISWVCRKLEIVRWTT
ncbi:MAG: ABC transporter permease subunit [Eubacteriales bacterium]